VTSPPRSQSSAVVRVLLPFAAGYFFSYLYRSVNAVIAPDLARELNLSPAGLGLLTSVYFLAFAAFQLPLGLLLDRFGPRRTDAVLLSIAACGAAVFALAPGFTALVLGRALIGLGVSGGLMSGIKANVVWFPLSRLGRMNGWMFFAGGMGMVAATVPVEAAVKLADWRTLFVLLALLTLAASMLIFFVVPEREGGAVREPLRAQLAGLGRVFADRGLWPIALVATTAQAANMAVQGLWAGPWLRDVAGLGRDAVAMHLMWMACAGTAGFLFWGHVAARVARRGISTHAVYAAGIGLFLLLQVPLAAGWGGLPLPLWVAFGFLGTAGSLAYSLLPQRFPLALAGRANTALNALVFFSAFLVQWGLGAVIDLWPATASGYDPAGYRAGFALLLGLEAAAWVWMAAAMYRQRNAG
jgi:predicted MFS family arabinose efflux permease